MRVHPPVTRAILFEPVATGAMAALTEDRAYGLLPVANRPLLHHLISQLAAFGISEVRVYTASHHESVARYIGAGERWGVDVSCRRLEPPLTENVPVEIAGETRRALVMRMDCWPGKLALRAFLEGSGRRNRQLLGEDGPLPCYCGAPAALATAEHEWPMVYCYTAYSLDSPARYLRANLDALVEHASTNPVEQSHDNELFIGAGCRISESARFEGAGLIGRKGRIGKGVGIGPDVVTGKSVYLDAGARLEKCVVLPGTYVGARVALRGKIVDGNRIIDCRTGEVSVVTDPAVLSGPLRRPAEKRLARGVFRWLTARPGAAA